MPCSASANEIAGQRVGVKFGAAVFGLDQTAVTMTAMNFFERSNGQSVVTPTL
jgi:hypothetical protein